MAFFVLSFQHLLGSPSLVKNLLMGLAFEFHGKKRWKALSIAPLRLFWTIWQELN